VSLREDLISEHCRKELLLPLKSGRTTPLGIVWCTVYLFACITCFQALPLDAKDFENLEELDVQDFEQQLAGEQGK
jgi:hypothetical protein